MKKTVLYIIIAMLLIPAAASAGMLGNVKTWITGEASALILSAVLTIIAGIIGVLFTKIARTFRETGEFLSCLGNAVEDGRITREELGGVIREGRDIFCLWK